MFLRDLEKIVRDLIPTCRKVLMEISQYSKGTMINKAYLINVYSSHGSVAPGGMP
jgi:hypothetical protein